jgi:hypothetical protein
MLTIGSGRRNEEIKMANSTAASKATVVPDVEQARRALGDALTADFGDRGQIAAVYAYAKVALAGMVGPLAIGQIDEESTFVLHASGVDVFRVSRARDMNVEVERVAHPPLHGGTYVENVELYPDPHVIDQTSVRMRVRAQYSHDALGSSSIIIRQRDASASVPDEEQSMFDMLRTWSRTIDPRATRSDKV